MNVEPIARAVEAVKKDRPKARSLLLSPSGSPFDQKKAWELSREEEIIRLRFGIGRDMPYTLEEIGRVMGLSRERVRQIEAAALKKIQAAEECRDLREFLSA